MEKIKVLHVTGDMNIGGAEVMLMELMRNKSPNIHFDFLINIAKRVKDYKKGAFDDEILELGGRIEVISSQNTQGFVKYYKSFKRYIQKYGKPDITHIHLNAKCGVIALIAKLCGLDNIISHSHASLNFPWTTGRGIAQNIELRIQRIFINTFSSKYWGCSEQANKSLFYSSNISSENCRVISNSIFIEPYNISKASRDSFRSSLGIKGELVIGNVGRIVKNKNLDFIFLILKDLHKMNVDFKFVFVGRKDDSDLFSDAMSVAYSAGFENKIIYLGESNNVPQLMNAFDVFLAPSENEGFGMVAIEAQAASNFCYLSTGFPKEIDLDLNLVSFIASDQPNVWANHIRLSAKLKECLPFAVIQKIFSKRGLDIMDNVRKVEGFYLEMKSS